MSRDVGRGGGGEEYGSALEVGRSPDALHRRIGDPGCAGFIIHVRRHGRVHVTGTDAVDPHAVGRPFRGAGLRHLHDRGLGRVVMCVVLRAVHNLGRHRRDIDNRSRFSWQHDAGFFAAAEEDTLEVGVDNERHTLLGIVSITPDLRDRRQIQQLCALHQEECFISGDPLTALNFISNLS